MKELFVGDKVKVKPTRNGELPTLWHEDMLKTIGKVGTIIKYDKDADFLPYRVVFPQSPNNVFWWYSHNDLELVEGKTLTFAEAIEQVKKQGYCGIIKHVENVSNGAYILPNGDMKLVRYYPNVGVHGREVFAYTNIDFKLHIDYILDDRYKVFYDENKKDLLKKEKERVINDISRLYWNHPKDEVDKVVKQVKELYKPYKI